MIDADTKRQVEERIKELQANIKELMECRAEIYKRGDREEIHQLRVNIQEQREAAQRLKEFCEEKLKELCEEETE